MHRNSQHDFLNKDVIISIPYWGIDIGIGIGIGIGRYWGIGISIGIDIGISITLRRRYLEKLLIFHKV